MDKILLIPYGWIGDRFFTTSVGTVLKRYMNNPQITTDAARININVVCDK